ncbi:MAG TPA: glycosyltransferase family 4 protein [Puia sp.]
MVQREKIRVLECIRQGKIGGGESYLLGLAENLDKTAFEPIVLAFTDGPMVARLKAQNIQTHIIYTERPFDWRVWKKVMELMIKERIDIVHAHGTRANSNVFWAAKKLKLPLVYTCHAWSFHRDQNYFVKKIRIGSERFLTGKADVNVCGSVANGQEGRKWFKHFSPRIIYNSIDPKKFNPYGRYKNVRAELGVGENELVLTSIARFTLQKQPLKLIQAFKIIAEQVPDIRLLMVGEGEEKEEAVKFINQWGLKDKIILQPFREDIPDILSASDIFILPSLWEAFPIALLEAMSMGKAVVGTRVDGTPEIIEDRVNGLLIPVENMVKHMVDAIRLLAEDSSLRKNLQLKAIETIYGKYNVDVLAKENEKIYYELMANA